ncbi:MAG: TonB-dependent receptor, partial [Pseudomonadota bacterium]
MPQFYLRPAVVGLMLGLVGLSAHAADELIVYVFDNGQPVAGADIAVDGEAVGVTRRDGSLQVDLDGTGQRILAVNAADGESLRERFSAGPGQLVDVIVDLSQPSGQALVEVYSRSQSSEERRDAPSGELQISVRRGTEPVPNQL